LAVSPLKWGEVGLGVYPLQLVIPVVGLSLAAALHAVSRRTRWGTGLLAVVQNRDAARLMGIPIRRAVAGAFALSALFAGVAGVLIAPLFNVHADMGTLFGLKAFAVAILGGITSAWGVMFAGLLFGVAEALITSTLGSGYTQILTFGLVIVALAFRPNGLFGRAAVKKV
jgi:branched-chain amino acid transport system permease protein